MAGSVHALFERALAKPCLVELPEVVRRAVRYGGALMNPMDASHDAMHLLRVLSNARAILREERSPATDPTVVMLGAALHDVADRKLLKPGETKPQALKRLWDQLLQPSVDAREISLAQAEQVLGLVRRVSYSIMMEESQLTPASPPVSPELAVVRDADLLDALGPMGVVRCVLWGASQERPFRSADTPNCVDWLASPTANDPFTTGRSELSSVNHFYDKLLRIQHVLATETARRMAVPLHDSMVQWLTLLDQQMKDD